MRAVVLIADNYVREQRWPAFFLLLWIVGFAAFGFWVDSESAAEDALMIFKQLVFYGVVFAVFFGSSALHSDLRSRRILSVLSKAVSRGQYLAGLLAGMAAVLGTFCLCAGLAGSWILGRWGLDPAQLWLGTVMLFTACLLTAALALCLSVFLPPLFAAIGSGLLSGLPLFLTLRLDHVWKYSIPVYALLEPLVEAEFHVLRHASLAALAVGVAETALSLSLARWIFSRRDIVAAVE